MTLSFSRNTYTTYLDNIYEKIYNSLLIWAQSLKL